MQRKQLVAACEDQPAATDLISFGNYTKLPNAQRYKILQSTHCHAEHRAVVQHELPQWERVHVIPRNSPGIQKIPVNIQLLGRPFLYPANPVAGNKNVLPSKNIAG